MVTSGALVGCALANLGGTVGGMGWYGIGDVGSWGVFRVLVAAFRHLEVFSGCVHVTEVSETVCSG